MASPEAIILLIVDYYAAIGEQDRRGRLAYTPVSVLRFAVVNMWNAMIMMTG